MCQSNRNNMCNFHLLVDIPGQAYKQHCLLLTWYSLWVGKLALDNSRDSWRHVFPSIAISGSFLPAIVLLQEQWVEEDGSESWSDTWGNPYPSRGVLCHWLKRKCSLLLNIHLGFAVWSSAGYMEFSFCFLCLWEGLWRMCDKHIFNSSLEIKKDSY